MSDLIEIWWEGPYNISEDGFLNGNFKKLHSPQYGIYQIYGNHPVFGHNSLLYIGKADEQIFEKRAKEQHWFCEEGEDYDPISFYFGGLGSAKNTQPSNREWSTLIDIAERILVCGHKPPFNSKLITDAGDIAKGYSVFNYGRRASLFMELSYERLLEEMSDGWKCWEYIDD